MHKRDFPFFFSKVFFEAAAVIEKISFLFHPDVGGAGEKRRENCPSISTEEEEEELEQTESGNLPRERLCVE